MNSTKIRLKIDRQKLSWLKFVMESYEGLALTTTLDSISGLVMISIAPGAEAEVADLILEMKADLGVVEGWGDIDALINNRHNPLSTNWQ
ncbi:MAG: DUF4911 domain-containing protein [Deltaproteobacteria bacterium]|nr:DUF4911 domain-containing protein [Deltaproteobacteria bacterium]MBW2051684.1 DUF4911 domain-containing protein [Deltaproteobacteria bacterium]MBW2140206.1 DUF4911 domain-containing protein [Deltaproteobacteria bacterium]